MRILIFGATGSIGQQTIDVIKKLQYQLVGISFFHHSCLAKKIKAEFKYSPVDKQISNVASYDELIKKSKPDLIVNAIVGFAGLEATLIALKHKIDLALANKESMVVAGQFVTKLAKTNKVQIYPIDSEHASLYQIIQQIKRKYQRLIITASGGPFYKLDYQALQKVNFQQAIKHPKGKMGAKISIDSATLVNKCFELIEAYGYFNTKNITALYHPEAYIHAIVDYGDDAYAFMNKPDMHLPIHQALTKFANHSPDVKQFYNNKEKYLLEKIDPYKGRPIAGAYRVLEQPRSSLPIIINAANETCIDLFKLNKIKFVDIINIIELCMTSYPNKIIKSIKQIYELDSDVRQFIINKWSK